MRFFSTHIRKLKQLQYLHELLLFVGMYGHTHTHKIKEGTKQTQKRMFQIISCKGMIKVRQVFISKCNVVFENLNKK